MVPFVFIYSHWMFQRRGDGIHVSSLVGNMQYYKHRLWVRFLRVAEEDV